MIFHEQQNVQRPRYFGWPGAERRGDHGQGLGTHATRLEGGHFLYPCVRRIFIPSSSGGRAEYPIQLRGRSFKTHERLRYRGHRNGCSVPRKRAGVEIQASAINVIGWVDDPDTYPIQPKPHSIEFLREVAHLRPRTNVIGAATRVRHTLAQAIHQFFDNNGFLW
jgi:hypothetical protein